MSIKTRKGRGLVGAATLLALAWMANGRWLTVAINARLQGLQHTQASVGRLELALLARELRLEDVRVARAGHDAAGAAELAALPVLSVARATLRWRWQDLLAGRLEGALAADDVTAEAWRLPTRRAPAPAAKAEAGSRERGKADTVALVWSHLAQRALPLSVASLRVRGGQFRWHDLRARPALHASVDAIALDGHNLTGREGERAGRYAHFRLRAQPAGGALEAEVDVAPDEAVPSVRLSGHITDAQLTRANDVLRAYAHVDVTDGTLSAAFSLASADGRFAGWVEPRLRGLHIDPAAHRAGDSALERLVRRGAAAVTDLLRGGADDAELATRVPVSGTLWRADVGVAEAAVGLLGQAFVRSLSPIGPRARAPR